MIDFLLKHLIKPGQCFLDESLSEDTDSVIKITDVLYNDSSGKIEVVVYYSNVVNDTITRPLNTFEDYIRTLKILPISEDEYLLRLAQ
jgi:hypothetical protein